MKNGSIRLLPLQFSEKLITTSANIIFFASKIRTPPRQRENLKSDFIIRSDESVK